MYGADMLRRLTLASTPPREWCQQAGSSSSN